MKSRPKRAGVAVPTIEQLEVARGASSMISPSHQNNFNLLRLMAAAQVVYMHSYAHLHLPTPGWVMLILEQFPGVACFFVISGFLVSESCLRSSTASFFTKRALRIYPGLLANILVLEAAVALSGGLNASDVGRYAITYLPAYVVTASQGIASKISGVAPYVSGRLFQDYPSGVLWTLTVELSFYLVLPLFMIVARRSRLVTVALILAMSAVSFAFAHSSDNAYYASNSLYDITIVPYFWVFGIGVTARLFWVEISGAFSAKVGLWAVIYAGVTYASIQLGSPAYLEYKLEPGGLELLRVVTLAGLVLATAYSFRSLTQLLRLDKNDYSYGLYLYHMLIVGALIGLGVTDHWWLWIVVYASGMILAAGSWFIVERPALGLKRRLTFRGRTGSPATQPPTA